jgi:hypothetical protein
MSNVHFHVEGTSWAEIAAQLRAALGSHPEGAAALAVEDHARGLPAGNGAAPVDVTNSEEPTPTQEAPPARRTRGKGKDTAPAETPAEAPAEAAAETTAASPAPAEPKVNGHADPMAGEPEILEEPAMRTLLQDYANANPQKAAGVVALLQDVGGAKRLLECPRDKWPAIAQAARDFLQAQAI